jgi:hypothetical protein
LTLRDENGVETDLHCFHTVLRNELARRDIQVGDHMQVMYRGRVDGGRGKSGYDSYKVVGGRTPRLDWPGEPRHRSRPATNSLSTSSPTTSW